METFSSEVSWGRLHSISRFLSLAPEKQESVTVRALQFLLNLPRENRGRDTDPAGKPPPYAKTKALHEFSVILHPCDTE